MSIFFFFSSRRRHTRWNCDWSSDVCSSDLAAMLGHWRPLFLRWRRGGKMVATCGGAFFGIAPLVGAIGAGVWLLTFLVLRYASVASMVSAVSMPLWSWLLGYPWPVTAFAG